MKQPEEHQKQLSSKFYKYSMCVLTLALSHTIIFRCFAKTFPLLSQFGKSPKPCHMWPSLENLLHTCQFSYHTLPELDVISPSCIVFIVLYLNTNSTVCHSKLQLILFLCNSATKLSTYLCMRRCHICFYVTSS